MEQGKTQREVLKTYLRSTMKEDHLRVLAVMHIHRHDVFSNSEDIVDDFSASITEAGGWNSF